MFVTAAAQGNLGSAWQVIASSGLIALSNLNLGPDYFFLQNWNKRGLPRKLFKGEKSQKSNIWGIMSFELRGKEASK